MFAQRVHRRGHVGSPAAQEALGEGRTVGHGVAPLGLADAALVEGQQRKTEIGQVAREEHRFVPGRLARTVDPDDSGVGPGARRQGQGAVQGDAVMSALEHERLLLRDRSPGRRLDRLALALDLQRVVGELQAPLSGIRDDQAGPGAPAPGAHGVEHAGGAVGDVQHHRHRSDLADQDPPLVVELVDRLDRGDFLWIQRCDPHHAQGLGVSVDAAGAVDAGRLVGPRAVDLAAAVIQGQPQLRSTKPALDLNRGIGQPSLLGPGQVGSLAGNTVSLGPEGHLQQVPVQPVPFHVAEAAPPVAEVELRRGPRRRGGASGGAYREQNQGQDRADRPSHRHLRGPEHGGTEGGAPDEGLTKR